MSRLFDNMRKQNVKIVETTAITNKLIHVKTLIECTLLRTTKQIIHIQCRHINSGEPDLQIADIPHTKTVKNNCKKVNYSEVWL